jgi:hypothetical protein
VTTPEPADGDKAADPDELLATALGYAEAGWPEFPCRPDGKKPVTRRGFCDATVDLDRIRAWWPPRRRRPFNVAITTEAPGPDGLDVDTKHHSPGLATLERLRLAGLVPRPHRLMATPSGGLHLYSTGSTQCNHAKARYGIDSRPPAPNPGDPGTRPAASWSGS